MTRLLILTLTATLLCGCPDQNIQAFNANPEATITSHADGSELLEGYLVTFQGFVSDPDNTADQLLASWSLGGEQACPPLAPDSGGLTSCETVIGPDDTAVTLVVTDTRNAAGSDSVSFTVIHTDAPQATLISPEASGMYYSDQKLSFEGLVSDGEDDPTALLASWESDLDGSLTEVEAEPEPSGQVLGHGYLSQGEHAIELHVQDSSGKTASDSVIIRVGAPNSPPACEITAPASGSSGAEGVLVTFEALVSDVDVAADWLGLTWTSDKDGELGQSTPDSDGTATFACTDLSTDTHTISITVTDEVGATCTDSVLYTVGTPPQVEITAPLAGEVYNDGDLITFAAQLSDAEDSPNDLGLSWYSSLDGIISTEGADSGGLAGFSSAALSTGTHTLTLDATDSHGLVASDTVDFTVNALPTAPSVSIAPDPPITIDDLVATATGSSDPDGSGTVTYGYAWYEDGVLSTASSSDTFPAYATTKGHSYRVVVTPSDGTGDGASGQAEVAVINSAPSITTVAISPDPARVDDTLGCSHSGFSDPDGDADASSYAWTIDGAAAGSSTVLSGGYARGDSVTCTVTPDDGSDTGTAVYTSLTISNSAPGAPTISIDPVSPEAGVDDLTCLIDVESIDADADAISYAIAWSVDGASWSGSTATTYVSSDTILAADTGPAEDWTCTVTPNDGIEDGSSDQASVYVEDSFGGELSLSTADAKILGEASGDLSAYWVAMGDMDADGLDDLLIGAVHESTGGTHAGAAYLVLGTLSGTTSLTTADAKLVGEYDSDYAGSSVAVGDINADGVGDMLIGALWESTVGTYSGAAYLVLGPVSGTHDLASADAKLLGVAAMDYTGRTVAAGDVSGDGQDDFLVGADVADQGGTASGAVYVVQGPVSGTVDLTVADALLVGENASDYAGDALTSADLDGDGIDDILVGAPWEDSGASGAGALYSVLGPVVGTIDLSVADAKLVGEAASDLAGTSVATGDVNADGTLDIIVGAPWQDGGGYSSTGAGYLVLGPVSGTQSLSLADATLLGEGQDHYMGRTVEAGDIDANGYDDILLVGYG